jgi:succinate-semialdehyde dehydrogenase/glutarate-semialdehyde dehydrogenase
MGCAPGQRGSIARLPKSPAPSTPSNAASGSDREHAVPTGLFIGGTWRPAASGATLPVDDPATGQDARRRRERRTGGRARSGDAAVAAQPGFAATPPRERGEILRRAYALMAARIDDLALLMTLEMGKPRPSGSVC